MAVQGDEASLSTPHPMVVRAVLNDIPKGNAYLEQFKIYASGRAPWGYLVFSRKDPSRTPLLLRPMCGCLPE